MIKNILNDDIKIEKINDKKLGEGIQITYTEMYEAPELSFMTLKKLSDYFGTNEIDIDSSISMPGCETCDYGSSYGHYIQIYKITKNFPEVG